MNYILFLLLSGSIVLNFKIILVVVQSLKEHYLALNLALTPQFWTQRPLLAVFRLPIAFVVVTISGESGTRDACFR